MSMGTYTAFASAMIYRASPAMIRPKRPAPEMAVLRLDASELPVAEALAELPLPLADEPEPVAEASLLPARG